MNPLSNTFSRYPFFQNSRDQNFPNEIIQLWINLFDQPTFDSILLAVREAQYGYDVEHMLDLLRYVLPHLNVEQIFALLSKIVPHLNVEQTTLLNNILPDFNIEELLKKFETNTIPLLLQNSTPSQQQAIALQLAQWYFLHSYANYNLERVVESSLQAMHYFAKAIQIATIHQKQSIQEIHILAQPIFIRLIKHYLIKDDAFKKRLDSFRKITNEDIHGFETFTKYIIQIEQLEKFCFTEEDHSMKLILYGQAASILNFIPTESQYDSCFQQILYGLRKPFSLPTQCSTEKYADELIRFRKTFASLDTHKLQAPNTIRIFQKSIIEAFKRFFQILLDDAFAILGPPPCAYKALRHSPPCTYDIRAMGSLGREEICPYSDLEFMILIEDPEAFNYFKTLVHILEIQIASLGETSTSNPVFTCIHTKNPSGFHIDGSPTANPKLIQTPADMAKVQNNSIKDPCTIENTVLKTISLSQTDPELFTDYQTALEEPLKVYREERAFQFFTIRLSDYKKHWKQPFNSQEDIINIKQHYVEILNHLLSDIAFFYGITKTNTLDIVDALLELKIFTEESGSLLKESVAAIYAIRIRLHTLYKKQKEEGSCHSQPHCKQLLPFEIFILEKCYWLILRPLYARLEMIPTATDFKTTFQKIDLIQSAFKQNFSSQILTKPFIIHLASHLCQINAAPETHLDYFRALSELSAEHPRQVYLEVLERKQALFSLQRLLYIPNQAGLRPIFLKDYEWIKQGLTAITDPFDTQVPGQTVVCITAPHFTKPRYLKPSLIPKIMNGEDVKSEYTNSAHAVCHLSDQGYDFHLKQQPFCPLMGYAIHNLASRVGGKLTPSAELVRFDVYKDGEQKSYPVLVSESIPGKNLKYSQKGPYNEAQYTRMLLLAILTRPRKGKLSNYIIGNQGMLYCVDSDRSFTEPIIKITNTQPVYFHCALFCLLPLSTPLHVKTLQKFRSLDGDAIFNAWIEDVIEKEKKYSSLFTDMEKHSLFYAKDSKNTFTSTILFREGTLSILSLQFKRLQNRIDLSLEKGEVMTAGDLLKELISLEGQAIGNHVYEAYNNKEIFPEKRLKEATSKKRSTISNGPLAKGLLHEVACLGNVPTLEHINYREVLHFSSITRQELFSIQVERITPFASAKKYQGKMIAIEANFKEIKQETKRQMLVIKAITQQFEMMKPKPKTLIFHYCNMLTFDLLKPFLHNDLESLDLRCCEKIDNKVIQTVVEKCINLQELLLAGCEGITEISGSFFSPMLIFPNLKDLDVSHCANLHTLKLEARSLWNLKGTNNPILKEVKLISKSAKVDFNTSPQVALTHIKTHKPLKNL